MPLRFTTCQAPIADSFFCGVVALLARNAAPDAVVDNDADWDTRMVNLANGDCDAGWICGLQYTDWVDSGAPLELLAAPVKAGARYNGEPVYFSDVIVRHNSAYANFGDLRGARWLCNEPNSFSGCHVLRYTLAQRRLPNDFFGSRAFSGAHGESVRQVLNGTADATAIDSTVLDALAAADPQLLPQLRVIDILGPSPRPPWVIHKSVPVPLRAAIRKALLLLHESTAGAALLAQHGHSHFAPVTNRHYDAIRQMLRLADRRDIWMDGGKRVTGSASDATPTRLRGWPPESL